MLTRSVLLPFSYLRESSLIWYVLQVDTLRFLPKFPVASSPRQSSSSVTQPTALGVNDTNVAELSQALQSSLSLDTNTQLPKPNTCVESPPKASCEASADEHEKENAIEAKVLPAVSGGTEFPANTSFVGQELPS